MKLKIIIILLILFFNINTGFCNEDEIGNGEFKYIDIGSSNFQPVHHSTSTSNLIYKLINFKDVNTVKKIKRIQMSIHDSAWSPTASTKSSDWYSVQYRNTGLTGTIVNTGVFGFSSANNRHYVTAFFDGDMIGTPSNLLYITTSTGVQVPTNIRINKHTTASDEGINFKSTDASIADISGFVCMPSADNYDVQSDTYYEVSFYNSYNWSNNISVERLKYNQERNLGNKSKTTIIINGSTYYEDTEFKDTNINYYLPSYTSDIWNINIENEYGTSKNFNINFFEGDNENPTLTTDKTTYNTSEQITISYTNLDNINLNDYVDLSSIIIMYPDIDKYTGYDKKYIYNLLYHEYDGSFTINTSFLSPQTDYTLFACDIYDKILFEGDSFNVYSDDEYLSISCDAESNCISSNNGKNTFYYKINNDSNIIIKDNDNNIINTYYDIIGTGVITYTIPGDTEHLNTYPNWKIYLNNTDYSTSYNKNMEVYWSLFATPTPTPTPYPTATPDINISDQLDNLTIEIQPLKELLYGFVYIVIDNPDYDKDNIIDENEINHWFNSLIPMCLFLLLIILYIGLKKNRD